MSRLFYFMCLPCTSYLARTQRPQQGARWRHRRRRPPRSPPPQCPVRSNGRARSAYGGRHRTLTSVRAVGTSYHRRASRNRRARTTSRRGSPTCRIGPGAVFRRAGRGWGAEFAPPMGVIAPVRNELRRFDPHGRSKADGPRAPGGLKVAPCADSVRGDGS